MPYTVDSDFLRILQESTSMAEALRKLGRANVGSNYRWVQRRIDALSLDTSHWQGRGKHGPALTPQEALGVGSPHSTGTIKKYIRRNNLLPYRCAICSTEPIWNGRPLVLRLDHINGQRTDHRLENLRFVCPNCDSQTDTYCGKNRPSRPAGHCLQCGADVTRSVYCRGCAQQRRGPRKTKIQWPTTKELRARIAATSLAQVASDLGVSGTAIHKRLNRPQVTYDTCACGARKRCNSAHCRHCATRFLNQNRVQSQKVVWPSLSDLLERLKQSSYTSLARELGVSDNAIRKHLHYAVRKHVPE